MEAAGKKTKTTRDRERDVSEKIALGQMPRGAAAEVMYDQRLFNQSEGLSAGFGADDCACRTRPPPPSRFLTRSCSVRRVRQAAVCRQQRQRDLPA
jgi:hypothetical protein